MKTEKEREAPEQQLKKRARQIIDAVFASPCVVETRCFSQPEAVEQLEDQIVALLLPPPQIPDKRVAEIREQQTRHSALFDSHDRYKLIQSAEVRKMLNAIDHLLSLLQQPATSEPCGECGHDCGGDEQGCEAVVNENPLTLCGHRCVFPATEATQVAVEAEKPQYDLDPLEFWQDLAEALGHPRPTKADVPALVSEVAELRTRYATARAGAIRECVGKVVETRGKLAATRYTDNQRIIMDMFVRELKSVLESLAKEGDDGPTSTHS